MSDVLKTPKTGTDKTDKSLSDFLDTPKKSTDITDKSPFVSFVSTVSQRFEKITADTGPHTPHCRTGYKMAGRPPFVACSRCGGSGHYIAPDLQQFVVCGTCGGDGVHLNGPPTSEDTLKYEFRRGFCELALERLYTPSHLTPRSWLSTVGHLTTLWHAERMTHDTALAELEQFRRAFNARLHMRRRQG